MCISDCHIMPVLGWQTFKRNTILPKNRLICDMPTRWNSTLAMLQRKAINEYLCQYGSRTGSGELGFFSPRQWDLDQGCMHCPVTI